MRLVLKAQGLSEFRASDLYISRFISSQIERMNALLERRINFDPHCHTKRMLVRSEEWGV